MNTRFMLRPSYSVSSVWLAGQQVYSGRRLSSAVTQSLFHHLCLNKKVCLNRLLCDCHAVGGVEGVEGVDGVEGVAVANSRQVHVQKCQPHRHSTDCTVFGIEWKHRCISVRSPLWTQTPRSVIPHQVRQWFKPAETGLLVWTETLCLQPETPR